MIPRTQLDAYHSLDLPNREASVLAAIRVLRSATDREVADYLKWPINCVTGRRNGLVKRGLVEEVRVEVNPRTHRPNTIWRVKRTEPVQMAMPWAPEVRMNP